MLATLAVGLALYLVSTVLLSWRAPELLASLFGGVSALAGAFVADWTLSRRDERSLAQTVRYALRLYVSMNDEGERSG